MILDVNTLDLRKALQACLPHVADPKLVPDLAVLHFVATDENLFVTGMNRVSLGQAIVSVWEHRELTGDVDEDCFDLYPETAKELLQIFKSGGTARSDESVGECIRIRVTEEKISLLDVSGLFPARPSLCRGPQLTGTRSRSRGCCSSASPLSPSSRHVWLSPGPS
ncbi:hypothetical protein [Sinomonas sp. P47F7]|uniref:hypothetical protein n=1 Tax=Sinomonas sp. P47F7 TaxID=3410987 RepID=UPI003BF5E144